MMSEQFSAFKEAAKCIEQLQEESKANTQKWKVDRDQAAEKVAELQGELANAQEEYKHQQSFFKESLETISETALNKAASKVIKLQQMHLQEINNAKKEANEKVQATTESSAVELSTLEKKHEKELNEITMEAKKKIIAAEEAYEVAKQNVFNISQKMAGAEAACQTIKDEFAVARDHFSIESRENKEHSEKQIVEAKALYSEAVERLQVGTAEIRKCYEKAMQKANASEIDYESTKKELIQLSNEMASKEAALQNLKEQAALERNTFSKEAAEARKLYNDTKIKQLEEAQMESLSRANANAEERLQTALQNSEKQMSDLQESHENSLNRIAKEAEKRVSSAEAAGELAKKKSIDISKRLSGAEAAYQTIKDQAALQRVTFSSEAEEIRHQCNERIEEVKSHYTNALKRLKEETINIKECYQVALEKVKEEAAESRKNYDKSLEKFNTIVKVKICEAEEMRKEAREDRNKMTEDFDVKFNEVNFNLVKTEEKYAAELDHTNNQLAASTIRAEKAESDLKGKNNDIVQLKEEFATKLSNMNTALTTTEEKLARTNAELQEKNGKLMYNETALVDSITEAKDTKEKLDDANIHLAKLEQDLVHVVEDRTVSLQRAEKAESVNVELKASMNDLTIVLARTEEKLTAASDNTEKVELELQTKSEILMHTEASLANAKLELSEVTKNEKSECIRANDARVEADSALKLLKESTEKNESLANLLDAAKEAMVKANEESVVARRHFSAELKEYATDTGGKIAILKKERDEAKEYVSEMENKAQVSMSKIASKAQREIEKLNVQSQESHEKAKAALERVEELQKANQEAKQKAADEISTIQSKNAEQIETLEDKLYSQFDIIDSMQNHSLEQKKMYENIERERNELKINIETKASEHKIEIDNMKNTYNEKSQHLVSCVEDSQNAVSRAEKKTVELRQIMLVADKDASKQISELQSELAKEKASKNTIVTETRNLNAELSCTRKKLEETSHRLQSMECNDKEMEKTLREGLAVINEQSEEQQRKKDKALEQKTQKIKEYAHKESKAMEEIAILQEEIRATRQLHTEQIKQISKSEADKLSMSEEQWKRIVESMEEKQKILEAKLNGNGESLDNDIEKDTTKPENEKKRVEQIESTASERIRIAETERDCAIEETASITAKLEKEAEAGRMLICKLDEWEKLYRSDPTGHWGNLYKKMLAQWDRHVDADSEVVNQ